MASIVLNPALGLREAEDRVVRSDTHELATALKHAQDELRRKDEHLRQVLEALPAAVYTTDAAGRITYYNRAAADLAGRDPELGKDEWCVTFRLFTSDGEPLDHDACPMAVTLRENRAVRGVEAMAQRPDGSLFPFLPFPTPLQDENGNLVGAVNMLVDISERKQAEANQRILLDELNHRVKNNMQMLHSLLRSAQRETDSPEAQAVLAEAGQRVAAMAAAQRLLYSDRSPESVQLDAFLHAVCDCAAHATGANIAIETRAGDGQLSNDVSMPLALVLNELLTNAARHGGDRIRVSLHREDGHLVMAVEDNGPGFDLNTRERRSSGLGLVKGLLRQLRGGLTVECGDGARCVVRFPEVRVK